MSRFGFSLFCVLTAAACLCGCQTGPQDSGFSDVQRDVTDRTGLVAEWNGRTIDDAAIAARVSAMLAHELTAAQAAQIALLNNHHLQATFEDIGIAQADLVQAGLLKNPVFDLGVRFPDRSPAGTYLDFAVAEDFLDIALLPARKKLAAARFAEAKATISAEVQRLAADTRVDFYAYQAAEQMLKLRETVAKAAAASLDAAKQLRDAGNIDDLAYTNERASDVRAKIDLADAKTTAADSREKVNDDMGLIGSQTVWTAAALAEIPAADIGDQNFESLAVRQRSDVAAARQEIIAQSRTLGLTADFRFFDNADLGAEFERETDGQWRIGPALSIPLPLFDQGQAKISRAKAVLRQSEERCLALIVDVQSQVRTAEADLSNAHSKALLYRDEVLPIENDLLHQTELRYNGMLAGVFQLLDAKRQQIDAASQYIGALRDYWIARTELERAVGGRIPAATASIQPQTPGGPS